MKLTCDDRTPTHRASVRLMYNWYNQAEDESGLTALRRPIIRFPSPFGLSEKWLGSGWDHVEIGK